MRKKVVSLLAVIMILVVSIPTNIFANENGKVIFISMNRTNLLSMLKVPFLKEELDTRGYVGLMNIRGDNGTGDRRSYASMGAGGRATVSTEGNINFRHIDKDTAETFKAATGQKAKEINNLTINQSINENIEKGSYGSTLGALGQTLSDNGLIISAIGNADRIYDGELVENRNIGLLSMDQYGRIDSGDIENINIEDSSMPYGIATDYEKLTKETEKYYKESDVIFIELGDTYRLDMYKSNLNDNTYSTMKTNVLSNIDNYLKEVFSIVGEDDTIYIASAYPSDIDYKNKRRLSPIIKFKGNGKGILSSSTTRRDGIVGNLDVAADILNEFDLNSDVMVGRSYTLIDKDDNIDFLSNEYEKIVSISNIRTNIINIFVGVISASWIIAMVAIFARSKISNKEVVFTILKELIKLGIIIPLSFLISPLLRQESQVGITMAIAVTTLVLYLIGRKLFNDDLKQMAFFALITILVIVIDSIFGTYLMQNNIMSYDAIIGARYYGIGNEYEGVTIASAVFALAVLLEYDKIPKWIVGVSALIILITSAYPSMGANVGGAISESIAYLLFMFLIFDIKLDIKKIMLLGLVAIIVVATFAVLDIVSGSESHLALFINQILVDGPSAVIQTFSRKIQMNLKLAQTSVWVNILLAGIAIIAVLIFRPSEHFKKIGDRYPIIFKGFVASMVGCIVTLLVNDSGIVAAATASIYILIPIIIININMIIFNNRKN